MNRKYLKGVLGLLSIVALGVVCNVQAAWTGPRTIANIKFTTDGFTIVTLKDFYNTESSIACTGNNLILRDATSDAQKMRTSVLLAAYVAKTPINISYYGCDVKDASMIAMSSISLSE